MLFGAIYGVAMTAATRTGYTALALVYRGTPENAAKFIAAQDALIEELYAEPEPENSGETAEGTKSKESEGAELSAESGAAE